MILRDPFQVGIFYEKKFLVLFIYIKLLYSLNLFLSHCMCTSTIFFYFILFSGIQQWESLYAPLKAMKGSFTALYGLRTSLVVLHLLQVNMMAKQFSQQLKCL